MYFSWQSGVTTTARADCIFTFTIMHSNDLHFCVWFLKCFCFFVFFTYLDLINKWIWIQVALFQVFHIWFVVAVFYSWIQSLLRTMNDPQVSLRLFVPTSISRYVKRDLALLNQNSPSGLHEGCWICLQTSLFWFARLLEWRSKQTVRATGQLDKPKCDVRYRHVSLKSR